MNIVNELLLLHPLAEKFERPTHELQAAFPEATTVGREGQMLLQPFVRDRPQKFFDRAASVAAGSIIDGAQISHVSSLPQSLVDEVTEALRFLRLANTTYLDPTRRQDGNDDLRVHRLHSRIFAQYSHLAEHVLGALLALLVELSAQISGRSCTVGHDLRTRWNMAQGKRSGLAPCLSATYSPTVRNAIIHGGVALGEHKISFCDDNNNVEHLSYSDAEHLADRLLDTCNGICAALVRAVVLGLPLATRLSLWARTDRVVALSRTPLLVSDACYLSNHSGTVQSELHGVHNHWRADDLILDIGRAMVLLKASFPEASRAFLSFRSSHDTPTFFAVPYDKIPDPNANFSEMVDLFRLLSSGEQGMIWLEHRRMIPALFSKTLIGRYLNWADALDLSASSVDCELREMKDISVGWHSRYDAIVVSAPRVQDLDDEARPTTKYLKSLFTECSLRWFLRSRTRPMGTKRFRIFDLAMIHVYHRDSRRAELSGSGLTENLLFRAQAGNCGGPPFSGSVWEKIGPYQVTLNRAGHDALKRFRAVSLTRTIGNP